MGDGPDAGSPGLLQRWTQRARRRIRQWQGSEPRTRVEIRCEQTRHGEWWVCPMVLRPKDVVYCIDRGSDLALERTLLERYGARTYIFDADPETADRADREGLLEEFQLYAINVGAVNQAGDPDRGPDGARTIRLPDLMRMLGHRRLELLKIDVDTADAILHDVVEAGIDIHQLLVRFRNAGTEGDRERIEGLVHDLHAHGFRIFRISPDGTRYSFLRTDVEST